MSTPELYAEGEALGISREVQDACVEAWKLMLRQYQIEILAVEATCVDDVWNQAGTLDRIARLGVPLRFVLSSGEVVELEAGTIIVLDLKTGSLRLDGAGFVDHWPSYAVQVASYAQSKPYDPDTDTRGEWSFE